MDTTKNNEEGKFMSNVTEQFSSMVFDDATMEALLPKQTYRALQKTI